MSYLKLIIYIPKFSFLTESLGLLIAIHNSSVNISIDDGFKVSTGVETNIAINRVYSFKLEKPYSECILDVDNYYPELMVTYFKDDNKKIYSQEDCIEICFENITITKIGCYIPDYGKLKLSKPCSSVDDANKIVKLDDYAYNVYKECILKCPVQCDSLKYNYFISQAILNNQDSLDVTSSKYNSSKAKSYQNTNLSLNIYYDSFYYTVIEEVIKTELLDLISGIGGTIGLFIGCSVLSIAEIFEFIFLLIEAFLKRKKVLAFDNKS